MSGKALVSRKKKKKKTSRDQRETQPGVTQTGGERGVGEGGGLGKREGLRKRRRDKEFTRCHPDREQEEVSEPATVGVLTNLYCNLH